MHSMMLTCGDGRIRNTGRKVPPLALPAATTLRGSEEALWHEWVPGLFDQLCTVLGGQWHSWRYAPHA
jgi:hypothetical protein